MGSYFDRVRELLGEVSESQAETIGRVADLVAQSLMRGGVWHVFGTGHSHMIAEELWYRAGGLAAVNAICYPPLMQHAGPITSTQMERMPGLAKIILDREDLRPGEVFLCVSNSGRNAVPVEAAQYAKAKGLHTVCLSSLAQSHASVSSAGVHHKLNEICEIVIDNCGVTGDAIMEIDGTGYKCAPTSTVVNVAIVEQIVVEVCQRYKDAGQDAPIFKSANLPGGDEWNARLIEQYRQRAKLY